MKDKECSFDLMQTIIIAVEEFFSDRDIDFLIDELTRIKRNDVGIEDETVRV